VVKEIENIFEKCAQNSCERGPLVTDEHAGEIMCGSCGLVLIEKIEAEDAEYRTFTKEEFNSRSRVGAKSSLKIYDMGLSTIIEGKNRDAFGQSLSGEMKNAFGRLRIWDRNVKLRKGAGLRTGLIILDGMRARLGLSNMVVEQAAYIFRKAIAKKITKGRSISSVISSSIYAACRATGTPRSLEDVAQAANIKKKDLQRSYRVLIKNLDIRYEPYNPTDFITKLSSSVNASEKIRRDALEILNKANKTGISTGKNPMGMAAAALNLACKRNEKKVTILDISKASSISNVTIRVRCEDLRKQLCIL